MTQISFDNYVDQIENSIEKLGYKLSSKYFNNISSSVYDEVNMSLLYMYFDLLKRYTLVIENEEGLYPENFLTPEEMFSISEFIHRILHLGFYIDFLLTDDDEYGFIPAPSGSETNEIAITFNKIDAY